MPLTQAFLEHNQKSDLLLPAPEHIAIFGGIPLLLGVSRYLYTLAASGKVIQDLAQSALQEETSAVSSQFSSARKRIDQKIIYKTMKKIQAKDEPAFKTILAHMQAGNSCASRLINRLNRLSGGQHG